MGYSDDYAHQELDAQGEEVGLNASMSEHEIMCEQFGLSTHEFAELSNNDRANMLWNWKTFKHKYLLKSKP